MKIIKCEICDKVDGDEFDTNGEKMWCAECGQEEVACIRGGTHFHKPDSEMNEVYCETCGVIHNVVFV